MNIRFDDCVAIVTGAGGGLGRAYALSLAARGGKVVVNDVGAGEGSGACVAAQMVADEIHRAGGNAIASSASVTVAAEVDAMVNEAITKWGRIDILINNAGILRDRSFGKMTADDFRSVLEVHLLGAFHCTRAVWSIMQTQGYGRIVMTTSSSGLYGNFGQSNYGAAKMAVVGLMQTLAIEGAKYGIKVNCIAPTAATRMTAGIVSEAVLSEFGPERVVPATLVLASESAPNRCVVLAGAGGFEQANVTMTHGIYIGEREDVTEELARRLAEVADRTGETIPESGSAQATFELAKATGAPAS
jgi:NAD(P)-dependent dehydrogenase (short-subunit alcohol dehydrogenase family)